MLRLSFGDLKKPLRILCLGAHSDDIEIGCGGTLLRILEEHSSVDVHWVVFSARGARRREALQSARLFLARAKTARVVVRSYRDGFFPYQGAKIKGEFERLKAIDPGLIFTHYRRDLHQDHRTVNELTWNTFRNHCILEYEIPKYDGDLSSPNLFVQLGESVCRAKVRFLHRAFASQRGKHWFTDDLFSAVMRIRGMEAHSSTQFAEAFYARKLRV
jgi:LmbE family N-acetylglucosaminyl deacetylase